MVSSRPSAVDSAAARPPAATRPDTTYGRPAISGVASTMMSPPITISASCTMPSKLRSVMVSSVGSTSRQAAAQAGSSANLLPTRCVVDVVLGEHREAGRGEVQQEDEEQRPEHRVCAPAARWASCSSASGCAAMPRCRTSCRTRCRGSCAARCSAPPRPCPGTASACGRGGFALAARFSRPAKNACRLVRIGRPCRRAPSRSTS